MTLAPFIFSQGMVGSVNIFTSNSGGLSKNRNKAVQSLLYLKQMLFERQFVGQKKKKNQQN